MSSLIHLQSQHTSLILKKSPELEILYWGARLSNGDQSVLAATQRPISQARLDNDITLSLIPELGRGSFGSPALLGHHEGVDWAPIFEVTNLEFDEHNATFALTDNHAKLSLNIRLNLDYETDVVSMQMTITNNNSALYDLNRLALTLPVPYKVQELMTFYGRWCYEFHTQRAPFTRGGFVQENRRGRTSHENFPGIFAGTKHFSEQQGEVYGFHLAWSGNHRFRADVKSDGRRFVQACELLMPGEVRLQQGESYTTPLLYASYSDSGLNHLSQNFHAFVRKNILKFPTNKPRPIHLNTWEAVYFNHDPEYILKMIDASAEMGIERFIIDDGWFKGRDDDRRALGDWVIDQKKYPEGFDKIVERIKHYGMEFGLWFEPEMISENSDLYRQHPDWLLEVKGYHRLSGRWQYLLDLQNDDCFNYLLDSITKLLDRYQISYIKWDMNREMVQPSHEGRAAPHYQTLRLYQLMDAIRAKHPLLEIESCSSGGGRVDYEVLKHTHRFWASDCNDALERQSIQNGISYFFPPEVVGAHIGAFESHSTRRMHHLNFRGLTALIGHMGVELDPVSITEEERAEFKHYIDLHKKYRTLLHSGKFFRLDSGSVNRNIYGVKNDDQILVIIAQLAMPEYALPAPLCINCLENEQWYQVKIADAPKPSFQLMKEYPEWTKSQLIAKGDYLAHLGVLLPILDPESAILLEITPVAAPQE